MDFYFYSGTSEGYVYVWTISQPGGTKLTPQSFNMSFSSNNTNVTNRDNNTVNSNYQLVICLRGHMANVTGLAFR